jgi:uncharacterized membrane protein YecN with MAPEG domain
MNPSEYQGPILITIAMLLLHYFFLVNILKTRIKLHKKYRSEGIKFDRYLSGDREMLAADRIQLNLLEHMPLFLTLMWLVAVFEKVENATCAGTIYLASRILYPFLMKKKLGREIPKKIFISTMIGYGVNLYFAIRLLLILI